jgi:long-chain acyl-CoA synthetase|tara:strand:+ start:265 stop:1275 length:1011 start_codon:yes stop_codon:yes gene_type:complete
MAMLVPIADLASLAELASAAAKRFGDKPALVRATAVGGAGLTYRALDDLVARGAGALSGFTPGSRVLLAMDPRPEWAAALFAILRAGLVAVPVAPSLDQGTLRTIVSFTTPAAAVLSDRTKGLSGLLGAVPPIVLSDWPDLFPATGVETRRDDLALLAFTSGSTDRPRAVELTHGNLLANLASLLAVRTVRPGDALLSMLPPSHLFELMAGLFAPLACGARVVYPGSPLPNRLVDSICDDGITHALAVPALVSLLYDEMMTREEGASRLRTLMVGAAALSSEWNAKLAALGIRLDVGYGLTEAAPIVNVATAGECPDGSIGRALPGVDLRVEDGEV